MKSDRCVQRISKNIYAYKGIQNIMIDLKKNRVKMIHTTAPLIPLNIIRALGYQVKISSNMMSKDVEK
jgi:copper chaperone CopZ